MSRDDTDLRPPQQARSRATLDRILEATEKLLETHLMDELTLADILGEAGVSVGSFYGRFKNKEALLPELHTRYARRLDVGSVRVFAPGRWEGRSLRWRVRKLVRYAVLTYRRQRGLLRALSLDWRIHPERVTPSVMVNREAFHRLVASALIGARDEITHPHAEAAVRFGLSLVGAVCRDQMLTGPSGHPQPVDTRASERWLGAELERVLVAYLESDPELVTPRVDPPALPDPHPDEQS